MYRTGKSYLLNRMLLNREKGFGVGPTVNPCTKGLWIWGAPVLGTTAEGKPINILVIDTEGLGALDEDTNHDVRVFSLALLLSSFFIYNSMGSIDETALQSLNLVVSITKHIRIKTHSSDVEPEEYSKYFPSFLWVVRDFTLQLIDEDGNTITSKEYFEKALELQNGSSQSVKQKNQIRKLIKSFFPELDCCTIVRPLTNEEHLQNLESRTLKELRPEFVEQIMFLRQKVLNRMKVKTLNGQSLSGEMLVNLAESYVTAINKGTIPNIENAWTCICKNECMKALQLGITKYDTIMQDIANNHFPLDPSELKEAHREASSISLEEFNKISVGNTSEYIRNLKNKIKQKYKVLRSENERKAKKCIQDFLSSGYMRIEQRLRNNGFGTLEEYEKELKDFQRYFIENGPPGPNRLILMLEFCQKAQSEVARAFLSKCLSEIELQKTLAEDNTKKLENQILELKEDYETGADSMTYKIRNLEMEKAELSAKEQGLRENCNMMLEERILREKEMDEKLAEVKEEAERTIKGLKDKIAIQEEQVRAAQERALTSESDSNKQQALLEQKVFYLQKTLEEARNKEKEYGTEFKNVKKDHMEVIKELSVKYEKHIKELQGKLEEAKDQAEKMENSLMELRQKYESEKLQLTEELDSHKFKYQEAKGMIAELKEQLKCSSDKMKTAQKSIEDKFNKERENYQLTIAKLQGQVKSLSNEIKTAKIKWEKEEAIRNQKQEFYEEQLSEVKKQLEEAQRAHDNMVKVMEYKHKNLGEEEASKQLMAIKEEHMREMKEIESNYKLTRERLNTQLEQAIERTNELELQIKLQESDHEKEIKAKDECISSLQVQLDKVNNQNKNLEVLKVQLLEEAEENYKSVIEGLEKQMEEQKKKQQEDLREIQKHSEISLTQLRNFYEIEKERLEGRIAEERSRAQNMCNQQIEEYEAKLREEQQRREIDVEALQRELEECERQNKEIIGELERETEMQRQRAKGFEDELRDSKEQLVKLQAMSSIALEQQIGKAAEERKGMLDKIERLSHEITMKEKQITTLESRSESIKQDLERNVKLLVEWKEERIAEKNALTERIETLKVKNQQISDELMQKKLEFSRESALLKQQSDFQSTKIKELQSNLEESTKQYEEKLKVMKQEASQQLKDTIDLLSKDKDQYEQKYDAKRKTLKELESNINKKIIVLEKEKNGLIEKCQSLEARNIEYEKEHQEEVKVLKVQIEQLKEVAGKNKSVSLQEAEKYKKQFMELDRELYEVQANYEKDKELWADRFRFLEQQRDQGKSDLMEAQRKFELTLEQLQKRGSIDKDKSETNQMALIASLEQKHKYQIKELNESHQHICNELLQKSKQLEKELKTMTEKLHLEQKAKLNEGECAERRINEIMDEFNKISKELDEVKAERDRKVLDYQKLFEKERENYKAKLQDIESKYTEIDGKRGLMEMQFEKERMMWESERNNLIQQRNEAKEIIVQLEKRKENLIQENDKLKSERSSRKPFYSGSSNVAASMSRHNFTNSKNYDNFGGIKLVSEERPTTLSTDKYKKYVGPSIKRIGDYDYK